MGWTILAIGGLIISVFVLAFVIYLCYRLISIDKKDNWVKTDEFENRKKELRQNCNEEQFEEFYSFLRAYKGGFIKRKNGKIVHQEYLNKEKGDLKGIFFNIIATNKNLSVSQKEDFRKFLITLGINGIDVRPEYETRDSKLINKNTDENDYERKKVGNIGEQIIRDALSGLNHDKYSVINGPVLSKNGMTKEYDHIVIGDTGIFIIETKAYGLTEGQTAEGVLIIEDSQKWHIAKTGSRKHIDAPTRQIKEQMDLLESIIAQSMIPVHPILALCNEKLLVDKRTDLFYDVVKVNDLVVFIEGYNDSISSNDKMYILSDISRYRVN